MTKKAIGLTAMVLLACGDSAARPDRELDLGSDDMDAGPQDASNADAAAAEMGADGETPDASPDGCALGLTLCTDEDGSLRCVDLETDVCHFGACGQQGFPGCPGSLGQTVCVPGICGPGSHDDCVDILNSPEHCGGCDMACAEGEHCNGGACEPDEQI